MRRLRSKQDIERAHRAHFKLRLAERYGIEITDEEYESILPNGRNHVKIFWKLGGNTTFGEIKIKNQSVWVVYSKKNDLHGPVYLTALSKDGYLPVPKYLMKLDYPLNRFEQEMNELIKEIHHASQSFLSIGPKDFFMKHSMHFYLKLLVKQYVYGIDKLSFERIIQEITDRHTNELQPVQID